METVVYVLDSEGGSRVEPWGWAAKEHFRGRWDGTPKEIAQQVGRELACSMYVHAVISADIGTTIVLRANGLYSLGAGNAQPWSVEVVGGRELVRPRLSLKGPTRRRPSISRLRGR